MPRRSLIRYRAEAEDASLLPPGRRSNARTGDDSGMVAARRDFLSRGYDDRYVTESAEAVKRFLDKNPEFLIDAACGEGHHTRYSFEGIGRRAHARC